jgi:hypothetical protein
VSERFSPERLLRFQAAGSRGSPFYAALLERLADECAGENPLVLGMMDQTPCTVEAACALRLLGGAHRCVLDGVAPELAAAWPTDDAPGDVDRALGALLELFASPPPQLLAALQCDPQTNEVGRAASLGAGLAEITRRTGMPVRLLEIGASAGLLSRLDHFWYESGGHAWGDAASGVRFGSDDYEGAPPFATPPTIVDRRACDLRPVDATAVDGARRLLSYCWPDQGARITRLRAALDIATANPVAIDTASADDWLAAHAHPAHGIVTVVMHSIMWQYLPEAVQQRIDALLDARGRATTASAPLARLALEPSPRVVHADLSCTLWPGGEREVLAHSGYHGPPVTWLASAQ